MRCLISKNNACFSAQNHAKVTLCFLKMEVKSKKMHLYWGWTNTCKRYTFRSRLSGLRVTHFLNRKQADVILVSLSFHIRTWGFYLIVKGQVFFMKYIYILFFKKYILNLIKVLGQEKNEYAHFSVKLKTQWLLRISLSTEFQVCITQSEEILQSFYWSVLKFRIQNK